MNCEQKRIGDICEVTSSKRVRAENRDSQGIPFYCSKEIILLANNQKILESDYISENLYDEITSKFGGLSNKDILLTTRGTLGVPYFVKQDDKFYFSDGNLIWLSNFSTNINSQSVYYYLYLSHINGLYTSAATTIPFLTIDYIKQLKIYIPALCVQNAIAEVLYNYDNLIEINKRRIAILQEMAMRIYREWFVFFRFPGHETTKFVDGIPVSWSIAPIAKLLENYIGGGWGEENKSKDFSVGGFVIRGSDIPSVLGGIPNKEIYRYHKESNIASRQLEVGDIIFEVSGGSDKQPLGRNCLITKQLLSSYGDKVICASFCKRLTPKCGYSEFLFGYLNQLWIGGLLDAYCVQITGISNFKFESFLKYHNMLIPPKELTMQFAEIVSPIYNEICEIGSSIELLQQMRDRLLRQLMSGQLEVTP